MNKKKFLICKKIGMTQNIDEEGIVTPITLLKLEEQQELRKHKLKLYVQNLLQIKNELDQTKWKIQSTQNSYN